MAGGADAACLPTCKCHFEGRAFAPRLGAQGDEQGIFRLGRIKGDGDFCVLGLVDEGADWVRGKLPRGAGQGEQAKANDISHSFNVATFARMGRVGQKEIAMTQTPKDLVDAAGAVVPQISIEDAQALHGQDGVVFLDVREPAEVAGGKVAGAVAIPRGVLEWQTEQLEGAKTVVVYCAAGGRAALAGETLKELGFEDVRNAGGYKDWAEAGGAVE